MVKGIKIKAMLCGMIKILSQKYRSYVNDDLSGVENI
jgi:hypothetical protein